MVKVAKWPVLATCSPSPETTHFSATAPVGLTGYGGTSLPVMGRRGGIRPRGPRVGLPSPPPLGLEIPLQGLDALPKLLDEPFLLLRPLPLLAYDPAVAARDVSLEGLHEIRRKDVPAAFAAEALSAEEVERFSIETGHLL